MHVECIRISKEWTPTELQSGVNMYYRYGVSEFLPTAPLVLMFADYLLECVTIVETPTLFCYLKIKVKFNLLIKVSSRTLHYPFHNLNS